MATGVCAFLRQIPDDPRFEVTVENRVELLLGSWRHVLTAQQVRSGHPHNARVRTRLKELIDITQRNRRERLNLGQPWSWFLIPRLELLVDAGILQKREAHGLSGYSLTSTGRRMRAACNFRGERGDPNWQVFPPVAIQGSDPWQLLWRGRLLKTD